MSDMDRKTLITVLDDFKVRFKVMTDAYSAQVDAAVKAGTLALTPGRVGTTRCTSSA
jgi:hypothetical protein